MNAGNWKVCKTSLAGHFSDDLAKAFYIAITSCVTTGKSDFILSAPIITNSVASACVSTVTIPDELAFPFNYGVDCNKFHNGLVNPATLDQAVNAGNWKVCKTILAGHFSDDLANRFYSSVDSCVTNGKTLLS